MFVVSPIALADPAGNGESRAERPVPALFTNVTVSAGLAGTYGDSYAWGDYNNDGYEDLLVTGYKLFRNNGPPNYDFTDVTPQSGIDCYGYAVWGDYNNDGYLDFFCAGHNESWMDTLWRNKGPPNYDFVNASAEAGGVDDGFRTSVASCWVDYDRDSYIDVYVMNYRNTAGTLQEDALWHNDGDGTFTLVTRAAGINDYSPVQAGMGVDAADYNNDGWPDIYAGNYLLGNNYLWNNNHNGTFTDLGFEVNVSGDPDYYTDGSGPYYGHTAGSCWGDYDNDGDLDLWVGNLAHKDIPRAYICDNAQLMKNMGFPFRFEDFKERAGIPSHVDGTINGSYYYDDDTFGGAWCDYDNDGWLDLYVPQVKGYHTWAWAELWHNNGDGTFTEVGDESGIRVWAGIGCAWADYNNDGQPDHVTEGTYPYAGPRGLHLFENQGTTNHYLKVKLTGTVSNRAAIGARLTVSNGNGIQIREVEGGTGGHAHQNSLTQGFGFGTYSGTVSLEIRWPSGIVQNVTGITLDKQINITEDASGPRITSISASNYVPNESETVTLSCTVSGSPSSFLWDLQGDGVFETVQNNNQPVQVSYDKAGRYYPAVKIMNGAGTMGQFESLQLIVKNVPPVSYAGENRTVNETETFYLDGSLSTDTKNDRASLLYNWSFTDGARTGWQGSAQTSRSFNQSGTYYATLGVKDNDGAISNSTLTIKVVNLPPTVSILMSGLAIEDTRLNINASGNDTAPDLQYLKYSWNFGDGSPVTDWSASPNTTHTYTASGAYKATVTVKDDENDRANATISISVAGLAPVASIEVASFETNEDSAVTLTGIASDTGSDIPTLRFRWDFGDGTASEWGTDRFADHIYTANGTYRAIFFVMDHDNLTANATCDVLVKNLVPTLTISTEEQTVNEDVQIEFEGSGQDTPTDALTLKYRWVFGDGNSTVWQNQTIASHTYTGKGDYRARLTVRDNDGLEATDSVMITVDNVAPVAQFKTSKTTVDEDALVAFNASESSDTTSDRPSLAYQWDFGDGEIGEGVVASHSYPKQKGFKVTLTVTDNDGATSTATATLTVKNVAPTVTAWADRLSVLVGTGVQFTANATDTPSDVPTLRYEWRFGDGTTANTRNASHSYARAGKYGVTVRVTDDNDVYGEQGVDIEVKDTVTPPPITPVNNNNTAIIAVGVLVAIAAAIGAMFFVTRKKRPGTPRSSETPDDGSPPRAAEGRVDKPEDAGDKTPAGDDKESSERESEDDEPAAEKEPEPGDAKHNRAKVASEDDVEDPDEPDSEKETEGDDK